MNNLTTQRNQIIKLLQDAGERGVSNFELCYQHRIKQVATRVHELKKLGFNIISKPFKNSVIYVLSNQPKDQFVEPAKKIQQWQIDQQAMDRQVKVWNKNLNRWVWEDVREPRQEVML